MTNQNCQETLQAGDDLVGSVGAAKEVGQEDEVIPGLGPHEAHVLEQRGQAVEYCGGEPGVQREALNQQVVPLLQRCHGLDDGPDQPDLIVRLTFLVQYIL